MIFGLLGYKGGVIMDYDEDMKKLDETIRNAVWVFAEYHGCQESRV
jgi:hypothetical protein